jgi:hypothetical protein
MAPVDARMNRVFVLRLGIENSSLWYSIGCTIDSSFLSPANANRVLTFS